MKSGRIIEVTTRPLREGGWVAIHEDVTEQRLAEEHIIRLARHDSMTGLANRDHFRNRLEQELLGLEHESNSGFALHCIDLDRFKEVNDTLGHPTGDQLLSLVAARLTETVRSDDIVSRFGGDEFAVMQRLVSNESEARALARRMIDAVKLPYQINGQRIEIGATIGIALAPEDGDHADTLLKKADMALYNGKDQGRGRFTFFEQDMEFKLRDRKALEADLHIAVAESQLEFYYQPIIELTSGDVTGCEALIRWRHPVRGMVSPDEFIPVAEEIGLISSIGELALHQACLAAASWPLPVKVAVNLSPTQFRDCDLVAIASSALRGSGLPASRLELEVTNHSYSTMTRRSSRSSTICAVSASRSPSMISERDTQVSAT